MPVPSPPDDPEAALNHALGRLHAVPTWSEAVDLARDIASGATTARLNRRQRWALLMVLGLLDRSRRIRRNLDQELRDAHRDRKRLRIALDDMRIERDAERKRADNRRQGRPGCGKVPVATEAEAHRFIYLVCGATFENPDDYVTYLCTRDCVLPGGMPEVWHIGHRASRAERAQAAATRLRDTAEQAEDRARRRGHPLVDYGTAVRLLGIIEDQAADPAATG